MNTRRLFLLLPLLLTLVLSLSGCGTVSYYSQAIDGHFTLMCQAKPVDAVLADPKTKAVLRQQLQSAMEIRRFAIGELKLPDNGSYKKYVQLDRQHVLWNVLATPELSLLPKLHCAPVVGCVAYRNYFKESAAEAYADKLESKGMDVYVGGVTAYSTIGWFRDPLVSSMMNRSTPDLAGVIFHELAHQKVFAKSDTAFTESFATVVETEGVRRWLNGKDKTVMSNYRLRQQRYNEFVSLILDYRQRLQEIYGSPATDNIKREKKKILFTQLPKDYDKLKKKWNGYAGFDRWMRSGLNNAKLASVGNYHQYVNALNQLLREANNDLVEFYSRAQALADMKQGKRKKELSRLDQSSRSLQR